MKCTSGKVYEEQLDGSFIELEAGPERRRDMTPAELRKAERELHRYIAAARGIEPGTYTDRWA